MLYSAFTILIWITSSICQSTYVLVTDPLLQWSDADAFCSFSYGSSLASIHDTTQNSEAQSLCTSSESCWIGLNDVDTEGTYAWTDGTSFDYGNTTKVVPWADGEPNNNNDEDCILLKSGYSKWNDGDCANTYSTLCNYPSSNMIINDSINDIRIPVKGQSIGSMDILDEIRIAFDFILYAYPINVSSSIISNIFNIGTNLSAHLPTIRIYENQINVIFSTNLSFTHGPILLHKWHSFAFAMTQSSAVAWLDDSVVHNASNISSHPIYMNQTIYITRPVVCAISGLLRNLRITTNNAYHNPFNYLCDYRNRFTVISGVWHYNASNCWLSLNQTTVNGTNVVWFGDQSTESQQWTDYKVEFIVQISISDDIAHDQLQAQAGLLFRAQNDHQYLVDITLNSGIRLVKIDNGGFNSLHDHSATIALATDYRIRVEAVSVSDKFDVYLENELIFSTNNSVYTRGSIGFRVHNATAIFKSLRITFPENEAATITTDTKRPTLQPTKYPTVEPTMNPTNNPKYLMPESEISNTESHLFGKKHIIFVAVAISLVCFICILCVAMCVKVQNERKKRQKKYVINRHVNMNRMHMKKQMTLELQLNNVRSRDTTVTTPVNTMLSFEEAVNDTNICTEESVDEDAVIEKEMDPSELLRWLTDTVKLPQYYQCLVNNGYECFLFIKEIQQKSELGEIGIELRGHKNRLWKQIQILKTQENRPRAEDEPMSIEGVRENIAIAPIAGNENDKRDLLDYPPSKNPQIHSYLSMPIEEFETMGADLCDDVDNDNNTAGLDMDMSIDSDIDLLDISKQMETIR